MPRPVSAGATAWRVTTSTSRKPSRRGIAAEARLASSQRISTRSTPGSANAASVRARAAAVAQPRPALAAAIQ